MFYSSKSQFLEKKNPVFPIEKLSFVCTSQEYDNIKTPYYPFFAPLSGRQVVAYRRLKIRKSQTFSSKSGRGHLRAGGRLQEIPNKVI